MVDIEPYSPEQAMKLLLSGKARAPFPVDGSIDLSSQPTVKKVPNGLSCFELNLSGSPIEELPEDIQVESSLTLRNCTNLKRLPDGLKVNMLDLQGCTALEEIPEGLDVWFLNLRGCSKLKKFPSRAKIRNGSLLLGGCLNLTSLPTYLQKLSTLDISDCPRITKLPTNLEVGLWIDVGGSGITFLPPPNHDVGVRWRSVSINHRIAFQPETITAEEALQQKNAELRRVMIERMGNERFVKEAKAKVIHRDKDAGGNRELLRLPLENDEDFVCLSCNCPSTNRHYLLRVPPSMETCHQAAAWIAGFDDPSKYKPVIET